MGNVNVRKRGKVYQYQFEAAVVDGKRKQITKSGFKTKKEAEEVGAKAYEDYLNTGLTFKETKISYSDYLDYWVENYCKSNQYLKPYLGKYRLASLTSVKLNSFVAEITQRYTFSRVYFQNILKVLKCTFREACDTYGLIRYNPTITLRLPRMEDTNKENKKHIYTQGEIDRILERFKDNDAFTCAFLTSCFTRDENRRSLCINLE